MEGQLHIAILSLHSCPFGKPGGRYTGGMNIYIQNLVRELDKRGHLVDVYTCSHNSEQECGIGQAGDNTRLIHIESADYRLITEDSLDRHVGKLSESIISRCIAHNLHYDLIHSHYWLSGMVGNRLKQQWKIPHVTMFHTLGAVKNCAGLGMIEPEFRISSEKAIVQSVDLIVASTANEKQELISRYNACQGKVTVIPCGINPALFHPIDKELAREMCRLPSKRTMLFVGRLDPIKGLGNLLQAIPLMSSYSNFQLVVVGGDGQLPFQFEGPDAEKIPDNIYFVGPVPHENMYLYYNSADFCVIPSYYESFSLVALESLACGTPIIATDVGEVRDVAQICPSCRIISGNEPSDLARNLESMLQGATNRKNGFKKVVDLYDWTYVAGNIVQAYETAVAINSDCKLTALHS